METDIRKQSKNVACLIGKVMRGISKIDVDDPAMYLPLAQLRVCGFLNKGPRTMSELGKELGISLSAITQVADRLERAGLAERVNESDDRRVKMLQLTDKGIEVMQGRRERRIARAQQAMERLALEEREAVVSALQVFVVACAEIAPDIEDDVAI